MKRQKKTSGVLPGNFFSNCSVLNGVFKSFLNCGLFILLFGKKWLRILGGGGYIPISPLASPLGQTIVRELLGVLQRVCFYGFMKSNLVIVPLRCMIQGQRRKRGCWVVV